MAKEVTVKTSRGNEVTGRLVREGQRQVSLGDSFLVAVTGGAWGTTLKGSQTTVVTKKGDYVTGRRIR